MLRKLEPTACLEAILGDSLALGLDVKPDPPQEGIPSVPTIKLIQQRVLFLFLKDWPLDGYEGRFSTAPAAADSWTGAPRTSGPHADPADDCAGCGPIPAGLEAAGCPSDAWCTAAAGI